MNIFDYLKKELVEKAYRYGLMLTPEALEYVLYSVNNPDALFSRLSREGHRLVRLEDLFAEREPRGEVPTAYSRKEEVDLPPVEERTACPERVRVLLYVEPDEVEPASWEREKRRILEERLQRLGPEVVSLNRMSVVDYERAARSEEEKDILGIVLKVEERGDKVLVYLENNESGALVTLPAGTGKADYVVQDAVVGFRVINRNGKLVAREVFFPFLPSLSPPGKCTFRLLVVPDAHSKDVRSLPYRDVDGVVLLGNVVNVYETVDPKAAYRELDTFLVSIDRPVFVVPGMYDVTRSVPPHPPIEESLMPESAVSDNVYLLGSPAVVKIGSVTILLYDGEYYAHTGVSPESMLYTRLVQPDISSYPYRSSRDYSLIDRPPHILLSPVDRGSSGRSPLLVREKRPYVVEIYSGKVTVVG